MSKTENQIIEDRDDAIIDARKILANGYFVLDTETTGLNKAQMCQIAIFHKDGTQYKSLVKPTVPIEDGATSVHKITNDMVREAPDALEVLKHIPIFGVMVIYNAPFDLGAIALVIVMLSVMVIIILIKYIVSHWKELGK
jgi:DNA polymerase III subunit epsilon